MLIQLTQKEALDALRRYFASKFGMDLFVEIMPDESQLSKQLKVELQPFMDGKSIKPDQKIMAIKALRDFHPLYGLRDAKLFIVDRWTESIAFVATHGRMPQYDDAGDIKG